MVRRLKIALHVRRPIRRWHERLADALRAEGHTPRYVVSAGARSIGNWTAMALAAETRLFGPTPWLFDKINPLPNVSFDGDPDLAMVLDGETPASGDCVSLFVDAAGGERALVNAIGRSRTPIVRIKGHASRREGDLVEALLAVEHESTLSRALEQVLARLVSLLVLAVRRHQRGVVSSGSALSAPNEPRATGPLAFMVRGVAQKISGRLLGGRRRHPHWRIGFRCIDSGNGEAEPISPQDLTLLPDDGRHFYADPVPFEHDGRTYLFFEAFPYADGKGRIGMVDIAADGRASAPRIVLETTIHLSYPLVIKHQNDIYMLPEMSAAGRIQLFRADPFPDRWVPDRVLLDGIVASDATPVFHDGRWWLFATLSDDGGSSWDQLGVFHAPDLFGPWTPHADNPVLIDAGAARPAGALWHEDDTLMRVAQDCRAGYGAGLVVCRVERLDPDAYAQTVVRHIGPPAAYGADGIHTFNRSASLEVFDLRFPSPADIPSAADRAAPRATARD